MPDQKRKIIICYLRADSKVLQDHVLNRMAAKLAPVAQSDVRAPVVHVEMFFPDANNANTGLSAGICYGGQVFMHPKQFSRPNWEFHSIPVTENQLLKAKRFCDFQRGASFNYRGFFAPRMCNIGTRTRIAQSTKKHMPWYCSELVSYALFNAGILDENATYTASAHPHAVYQVIEDQCNTFIDCARNISNKKLEL